MKKRLLMVCVWVVIAVTVQAAKFGDPAAPLHVAQWIKGDPVDLATGTGKTVYVVEFWATWCPPCREEAPLIEKIASDAALQDRGLLFFGADLGESAGTVRNYMNDNGYSYTVLLDTGQDLSSAFGVRGVPTSFFIDANGIIQGRHEGAFENEMDILQELVRILPQKGS